MQQHVPQQKYNYAKSRQLYLYLTQTDLLLGPCFSAVSKRKREKLELS